MTREDHFDFFFKFNLYNFIKKHLALTKWNNFGIIILTRHHYLFVCPYELKMGRNKAISPYAFVFTMELLLPFGTNQVVLCDIVFYC